MFPWRQERRSPGGSKALHSPNQPWWSGFDSDAVSRVLTLDYRSLLHWLNQQAINRDLRTGRGQLLQFGPQSVLPEDLAYEQWIAQTGTVPTRDNLHDRINALVWLTYPLTKAALNREQASAIEMQTDTSRRGPVRDAATLWDENLAVMVDRSADRGLETLLVRADWTALFQAQRSSWTHSWQIYCFGHALLEKLMSPYKAITAHTIVLHASNAMARCDDSHMHDGLTEMGHLDQQLSQHVSANMSPALFRPLPVMGIPGWDTAQDQDDFYQDTSVFRRPRSNQLSTDDV